ncbi:hypothetical protein LJR129_005128 [Acidovorax sp. LjRoot129]|uniref:hypothetical protein n=1 Tax=Acidovorax sp. LjRoot129 TaxID=3342260 RepID=UPI003ECCE9E9
MKFFLLIMAASLFMTGCATGPKPPPGVVGEYRPINQPDFRPPSSLIPRIFDFKYKGDPEMALMALKEVQPQLNVMPPNGLKVSAGLVNVDLRQVTLDKALHEIGKEGRGNFEIIYRQDPESNRDFAHVRYPNVR